jgi:hypothetical protein
MFDCNVSLNGAIPPTLPGGGVAAVEGELHRQSPDPRTIWSLPPLSWVMTT